MTVAVSGANGFTGRFVCAELKRRHFSFIALLRPGSDTSWLDYHQIPFRYADLNYSNQLARQLKGCSSLLNVASIGFGSHTQFLMLVILQDCSVQYSLVLPQYLQS